MKYDKFLPTSSFSHIYIEEDAYNYPLTDEILKKLPNAVLISINHYKDVFNRPKQDYSVQKMSPKIILAVKKDNYIYEGSDMCHDFGNKHFYYTSSILGCPYNCDYCYLQGMYTSANIVVFVNIKDFFDETDKVLKKHPIFLTISYDSDLLALENLTSLCGKWIRYANKNSDLTVELRTKSANYSSISHLKATDNIILAWTLSPDEVSKKYEKDTSSFDKRLDSINSALNAGWNVRLCFDPIIYLDNWQDVYSGFVSHVFSKIDGKKIYDVSLGVFRMPKEHLKRIRRLNNNSKLIHYPFSTVNGYCCYDRKTEQQLSSFIYDQISMYVRTDKIYTLNVNKEEK